ncbi:hyperosmotically inducible protein [Desulfotomaculum arcticum]|uniref:Hyperosmotically inducible protein n=1 Tax=Desulfotruncus arcticus DSM 17038 TaxID=1121424 RepID=A0A1I2U1U5_9FIRM|nr:BON domain-containing protein [Desulfotruncus arcticus]SFG70943.1 hyperosmotically inducible protein [Desulfotomaculum arcticum] [Desulfotruncus arcticus DSM 17038]
MSEKDRKLQRQIQEMLDNDRDLRSYSLKANVIDGEVEVTGIVDTLSEKNRLRKKLQDLDGVKGIELGLAISTDGAIDDESVTAEVIEELNANPLVNLRHVGARSVDGTVFLMGTTESEDEEREAVKAAEKARGVKNVISQLKVRPGGYDDESLEAIFHHQVNNDEEDEGEARIF